MTDAILGGHEYSAIELFLLRGKISLCNMTSRHSFDDCNATTQFQQG